MNAERITPIDINASQAVKYAGAILAERSEQARRLKYLGGGSFGRAVGVTLKNGREYVLKLLLAPDMMEKECRDLRLLRENCPVRVPAVLYSRLCDDKIPADAYAMEKIPGKSAVTDISLFLSSKKRRLGFADEVTSALHAVHECVNGTFGDTLCPRHTDWLGLYKPFAQDILTKTHAAVRRGELSQSILSAAQAAFARFDDIFCEPVTQACLIHGDLNVANIMVDKGRVSGFIDPLNSMYADREYDLFQFDNLTGKRFFLADTYIAKYGASRNVRAKLAFYGLFNEIYCYFKAGTLFPAIMRPLVKNMRAQLAAL